jgi:hypothetical protein
MGPMVTLIVACSNDLALYHGLKRDRPPGTIAFNESYVTLQLLFMRFSLFVNTR